MDASIDNSSDVRLQALKSLHMILQEKDQNVQTYKERAFRYERALQQAESRIAKLMQLHAGAAAAASTADYSTEVRQAVGVGTDVRVPLSHPSHPASESSSSSSSSTQIHSSSSGATTEDTLIAGQSGAVPQSRKNRLVTDSACHGQHDENLNPNRRATSIKSQYLHKYGGSNDLETDGDTPLRPSGVNPAGISMLPGVSRTIFDNAVKENVRLKKMLQDVLQKDGTSVKVFLERQEYADVIKQLRADLSAKQQQVDEMESWITMHKAGENQQILVQMLELQKRVQLLSKEGQVRTAMVDNCLKENDKLRNEITALKSQTMPGERGVLEALKGQVDQLQRQLEEERRKHHTQIQTLMEKTQERVTISSPNNDLESLKAKVAELEGQLKTEKENNQLQKEQLISYEDDFQTVEEKLKLQKDKNEKELLRLQGQIRGLNKEKQKLEKDYLAEKQRSQMFEGLIYKYAPDFFKATGGLSTTTCAQDMPKEPWMNPMQQPPSILVQDGPPSLPKSSKKKADGGARKTPSGVARSPSGGTSTPVIEGEFECPRCQRTAFRSVDHFRDHCSKCAQ